MFGKKKIPIVEIAKQWRAPEPSPRKAVEELARDVMLPDGLPEAVAARKAFVAFVDAYDVLTRARHKQSAENMKAVMASFMKVDLGKPWTERPATPSPPPPKAKQ